VPGGLYHVGSRGNRRCEIYTDDYERHVFLQLLDRVATRYRWTCEAYCLMSNHYHLVIQIEDGRLSDGMQYLNGNFSRWTNERHGYDGHLFRNRFWSALIADDSQRLQTCRYIVLNPVRAGLCTDPGEWPWSSYRACAGQEFPPSFLAVDPIVRLFGSSPSVAQRAYRDFVRDGLAGDMSGVRPRDESRRRGRRR
jgi:REP element-mobilizing transposase RayT